MRKAVLYAITIAAIALVAAVGSGLAVTYTATTISSNNTLSYSGDVIEIVKPDGSTLEGPLPIEGPTANIYENQVIITNNQKMLMGYKLRIDTKETGLTLRCWVLLEDARSWVIIKDMKLSVDDRNVGFIHDGVSSIPSSAITLSKGVHQFTFTIEYKAVTLDLNGTENTSFLDLSGARLVFVVGDSDPLPGVSGYDIINS